MGSITQDAIAKTTILPASGQRSALKNRVFLESMTAVLILTA